MRVEVRGVIYPSVKACAEALGVSAITVRWAVNQSKTATLGLGYKCKETNPQLYTAKPVVVAGQCFASMADLALAIGRNPRNVRASIRLGGIAHERIVCAVMYMVADREKVARKLREKENDILIT